MKILITGGTGFLGKTVSKLLMNEDHEVIIIDNKFTSIDPVNGAKFIEGSVTNFDLIEDAVCNVDFVFHFGGILGTNETLDIIQTTNEVNINGTVNVLKACTTHNVPMLFTSKPNPKGFLNPYSITKIATESYCMMFHEMYGTKVTVPKIMYLYGPGQLPFPLANYKKYIPTLVIAALKNEPLKIYGSGNQIIDPIYILEAAEVMKDIMNDMTTSLKCNGKIFDVGTGIGISINEIAKIILHLTGSKSQILNIPMRLGEPKISTVIADMSSYPLNQRNHYNFYKALNQTIDYYKNSNLV